MIIFKKSTSTIIGIHLLLISMAMDHSVLRTLLLSSVVLLLGGRLGYIVFEAYKNLQAVKIK